MVTRPVTDVEAETAQPATTLRAKMPVRTAECLKGCEGG